MRPVCKFLHGRRGLAQPIVVVSEVKRESDRADDPGKRCLLSLTNSTIALSGNECECVFASIHAGFHALYWFFRDQPAKLIAGIFSSNERDSE
jgi:hypothetical protein